MMETLLITFAAIILAPLAGGLLYGIDRKVTARLQHRQGPPIIQPFYDIIKLWAKRPTLPTYSQDFYVLTYLGASMLSVVLFALKGDLLVILFVMTLGSLALVLGAFAVKSPYSQIGAQRELMQMLAYEPILFIVAFALFAKSDSFLISRVMEVREPILFTMPLVALAMIPVFGFKLRKSPFDTAASSHAHQELVRGLLTEFSGRHLALVEVAHWYELILIMGFASLFCANPLIAGIILATGFMFVTTIIDNITARLTWSSVLRSTWKWGAGLAVLNLLVVYGLSGRLFS